VLAARAEAETTAVGVVWAAMDRDWRAEAWYLEHASPDRWARQGRGALDVIHHQASALDAQRLQGRALRVAAEARRALTTPPEADSGPETEEIIDVDNE
jgi:hypothetical protein